MLAQANHALFVVRAVKTPGRHPHHLLAWDILPDPGEEVVLVIPYVLTGTTATARLLTEGRGVRLLSAPLDSLEWLRDDTLQLITEALLRRPPWARKACIVELFDGEALPLTRRDVLVSASRDGVVRSHVVERLADPSGAEDVVRDVLASQATPRRPS